ncbi:hypothetical protein Aazo_2411 ['Nostoc azollae' 0708]|uniref:Uncharacterized protein n=1 Tax=Nostoc azollae (strain 0708) TaxID=551115 RepID=D7DY15_NOSA0|nr:hypothetical protein Aazo_2411 ['Nostoc azollae' 0708]
MVSGISKIKSVELVKVTIFSDWGLVTSFALKEYGLNEL